MTKLITQHELEHLTETELRILLFRLAQALYHLEQPSCERSLVLASIENIHRTLAHKRDKGLKM